MGKEGQGASRRFYDWKWSVGSHCPRQRYLLWVFGPEGLRHVVLWFADYPTAVRLRGIARVGIGIRLALRQYEELKHGPAEQRPWWQRWGS